MKNNLLLLFKQETISMMKKSGNKKNKIIDMVKTNLIQKKLSK